MLTKIIAQDIEPMAKLEVELAPRLNLLTGDNGLGKTLLLDLAWWGATATWARQTVTPRRGAHVEPRLEVSFQDKGPPPMVAVFDFGGFRWQQRSGGDVDRLVVYAQADGGFEVFDSYRESGPFVLPLGAHALGPSNRFQLSPSQVWDGLRSPDNIPLCNGLISDWDTWRYQKPELFSLFSAVLAALSPGDAEVLRPGPSRRVSVEDVRQIPTLALSYGEVPVTFASSAMRRIMALAYVLLWTWSEHCEAARLRNLKPRGELLLLVDELDAHLHPQWQRVILPALFQVFPLVSTALNVQLVASTHAPLVLASAEPLFDEERDQLLHFSLHGGRIEVESQGWSKQGDVANWLVSEAFGLAQARSKEAELVIEAAERFMRGEPNPPALATRELIDEALKRLLPAHDVFWPRWLVETGVVT